MRRCQQDLVPSPEHPGCIYGEMGMCLRPCQQVVAPEEYRHEVGRVLDFLGTDGRSLLDSAAAARERLSGEMNFEEAARQHKRIEKIQEALRLRDDLARDINRLAGGAITASPNPDSVELCFVRAGHWQTARQFNFEVIEGKPVSLDRKLREIVEGLAPRVLPQRDRQEYLALLARWYYSSWRDGEWLAFDDFENIPYRKLVHAISRVAKPSAPHTQQQVETRQ